LLFYSSLDRGTDISGSAEEGDQSRHQDGRVDVVLLAVDDVQLAVLDGAAQSPAAWPMKGGLTVPFMARVGADTRATRSTGMDGSGPMMPRWSWPSVAATGSRLAQTGY
jgi:hypothetical protein